MSGKYIRRFLATATLLALCSGCELVSVESQEETITNDGNGNIIIVNSSGKTTEVVRVDQPEVSTNKVAKGGGM